ncbi:conserved protein, unknown function, partial [Hepatocystis sp. ex Piliocolobus tephrosceles]
MKQLQLLKEKMKVAKAQKVEEVKKTIEDSFLRDNKTVKSFENTDNRFIKLGKKTFDVFPVNKKPIHMKNSRFPFQQSKSSITNFTYKLKNGTGKINAHEANMFDTPLSFEEVMRRKNEQKKLQLEKNFQNGINDFEYSKNINTMTTEYKEGKKVYVQTHSHKMFKKSWRSFLL